MRHILGAIMLAFNPLSRRELSALLAVPMALISTSLRHLHSVILIPTDESREIRVFHKSFPDFLQDPQRCTDPRFHINPTTHHGNIAFSCLQLMKRLKRNPCSLPPFTMNQDVSNLPQLLEDNLGSTLRYACNYWAWHLRLSPTHKNDHTYQVVVMATTMLKSAPLWIEVMSLENCLDEVIYSMYGLLNWVDTVSGHSTLDNNKNLMY